MAKNYVNNKKLLEHLIDYKERKRKDPNAQIDDYIARSILEIAERFASRPNFRNYTYKDDMVGDAVENVIRYIDNFDPEKFQNPFAYITQICYYAFLRKIKDEKTATYVRFKSIQKHFFEDKLAEIQDIDHTEDGADFSMGSPLYENMQDFIDDFEDEMRENKKKSKEYNRKLNKQKKEEAIRNRKYQPIEFEDDE